MLKVFSSDLHYLVGSSEEILFLTLTFVHSQVKNCLRDENGQLDVAAWRNGIFLDNMDIRFFAGDIPKAFCPNFSIPAVELTTILTEATASLDVEG